jgi:osmotically-inducible protein OsmY
MQQVSTRTFSPRDQNLRKHVYQYILPCLFLVGTGTPLGASTQRHDDSAPVTGANTPQPSISIPTVNTTPSLSDAQIRNKIREAVISDNTLTEYAQRVMIDSVNGEVTLHGAVYTEQEKDSIAQKAAAVVGSDHVINNLRLLRS